MDLAALLKLGDRASERMSNTSGDYPEDTTADKGGPQGRDEPRRRDLARATVEEKSE